MKTISDIVDKKLSEAQELFEKKELYRHIIIKDIDCSELPPASTDGKKLPQSLIDNVFSHLHCYDEDEIKINSCPAVYSFELSEESDRERVIEAFQKAKKADIDRTLPALKTNIPISKYLYVGKVEKEVGGRIVTHLGYYQTSGNHGLQLAFWARDIEPALKFNLHVFRFIEEFKPFIAAMEVIMARELNPIIGKH